MSSFPKEIRDVLGAALAAGRIALADMDDKAVPETLRRVRAHSGGRLPAPLANSLLGALDADPELRSSAVEHLDANAPLASRAFLEREDGWWAEVVTAAVRRSGADSDRRARADAAATRRLEARIESMTDKHRRAEERWANERARLESARSEAGSDRAKGDRDLERRERDAEARIAELEGELAAETEDRRAAADAVARLSDRLRRVRRGGGSGSGPQPGGAASMGADPVTAARHLDLMASAARFRHGSDGSDGGAEVERRRLRLPPGVRPDTPDAIEWLATVDGTVVLLVDGYNVLYAGERSSFMTGRARSRLIDDLARLARRGAGLRVAVFFDSDLAGDPDRIVTASGVEVRFTEANVIADDDIADAATAATAAVVVITSDRELQRRVETAGGLALFSEAFEAWRAR